MERLKRWAQKWFEKCYKVRHFIATLTYMIATGISLLLTATWLLYYFVGLNPDNPDFVGSIYVPHNPALAVPYLKVYIPLTTVLVLGVIYMLYPYYFRRLLKRFTGIGPNIQLG